MSTWVLLRGLTRETAHWGGFPVELARVMPGSRVVCVDLPGAGVLKDQPCPWQVPAMVDACRHQLAGQGVAPPYSVLGLSLGGMVAAAWSQAHPQEVACLVLVNTSMRPYSPPQRRLRLAHLPRLLRLLAQGDGLAIERAVLRLTSQHPERHAHAPDAWLRIRQARPVSAANTFRQLLAAARYRWAGPPPAAPVLVARSAGDALVDPACSQCIAEAWGADLNTHPDAGHDLPLDDGPWLAGRVAAWSAGPAGWGHRPAGRACARPERAAAPPRGHAGPTSRQSPAGRRGARPARSGSRPSRHRCSTARRRSRAFRHGECGRTPRLASRACGPRARRPPRSR